MAQHDNAWIGGYGEVRAGPGWEDNRALFTFVSGLFHKFGFLISDWAILSILGGDGDVRKTGDQVHRSFSVACSCGLVGVCYEGEALSSRVEKDDKSGRVP